MHGVSGPGIAPDVLAPGAGEHRLAVRPLGPAVPRRWSVAVTVWLCGRCSRGPRAGTEVSVAGSGAEQRPAGASDLRSADTGDGKWPSPRLS